MFVVDKNDGNIHVTRGDMVFLRIKADNNGEPYTFQPGEILRIKVFAKKNCENVVLQKDFPVTAVTQSVDIILDGNDTKIGGVINKPTDYWYEVELNPYDNPQTIIGYDEEGPRLFRLYPEGKDIPEIEPDPEVIKVIDDELDMASTRPVQNQVIARAFANLQAGYQATHDAVAALHVTPQMFGAIGDGEADDTEAVQMALNTKRKLYLANGVYKITEPLTAYNSIEFEKNAYIDFYPSEVGEACVKVSGGIKRLADNLSCTIAGKTMTIAMDRLSELSAGDYVLISNNEVVAPTAREYDTKRDILHIAGIGESFITFDCEPEHSYTTVNIDKLDMTENIIVDGAKIRCKEKVATTNGVVLEYAKNATIKNCDISNFDCGQITLNYCVLCDVHSNYCEINYDDSLQYGIVIHSCANITVYGNKVRSARTAIDVTRLSNNISVTGNAVVGSINTHSATNVSITNNTVNEGMILIRGKNIVVAGNNVTSYVRNCIDIEEMGIEGGHVISNNIFKGYCSMKCYLSNVSITGNHFIAEKVLSYGDGAYESIIRLMTAGTPAKAEGAVISGNTFEAVGITPISCIEANSNMSVIYNLVINDNVIRGFKTGLNLSQKSGTLGDTVIVKNNTMSVTEYGVSFRYTNNTQIVGNTIIGTTKGQAGIHRVAATTESDGLIVRDNYVRNFTYGFKVDSTGDITHAVNMDNIYKDVDTKEYGIGTNLRRIPNDLFTMSPNGTVYYLKMGDDGVITPNAMAYTV